MQPVDMARTPADMAEYEPNPYPCGLRISLDADALAKLGYDKLPELGTRCAFYVCGEVVSTSESSEYGGEMCMGVQIQQMAPDELPEEEASERYSRAAGKLYGKGK